MPRRFDNEDFRDSTKKFREATLARRVRVTPRTARLRRRGIALAAAVATLLAGCGGGRDGSDEIAFARAPATNVFSDLYLLETDGTMRRLTHGGIAGQPAWSPDGRQLAFQRARRGSSSWLYVADADGSGERRLPVGVSGRVDWSPDGRRLALTSDGRLLVANADGSGSDVLVGARDGHASDPRWSPDGRQIAFVLAPDGVHGDVYVVGADGTGRRRLTQLPRDVGVPDSPVWSPDGRRIAFLLPGSLRVIDADGTAPRVLARFPTGIFPSSPAWSPDSRTIAYARLKVGRDRRKSGLYTVEVDDGIVHRLTRDIDSSPSWSPDGRRIAFERLTGFHISEITVMDRDGSNQVSLTHGGWSDSTPAWRPAG
jgi:TolB protein